MSSLRRNLARHKSRPIGDLARLDFVSIIEAIEGSGRPGAAQDFRTKASAFLNDCADTGHLSEPSEAALLSIEEVPARNRSRELQ
jgi:hypothetical protein